MLKIDFDKIFQPQMDTHKAVRKRPARKSNKKKAAQVLQLGDEKRLAKLPDVVTLEFLSAYKENLDAFLYPYVVSGAVTLSQAHDYEETLITTIFGDETHLGIFQFLQDKNVGGKPDKFLVSLAEQLVVKGWHINHEGRKYWLINGDFQRVIDLTGKAELSKDAASMTFDEANAHLFLEDGVASKIEALAAKQGYNADDLANSGHLDLLLAHINNVEFAGYLVNYNNLRQVLRKSSKYRTLTEGTTMNALYEQGFRLGTQITFPLGKRTIMEQDGKGFIITKASSQLNQEYIVNKTLLSVVASRVKEALYKKMRFIQPEVLIELKELRQTFAVMREFWNSDTTYMTYSDMADAFRRLDVGYREGTVSKGLYQRVKEMFSAVVVTDAILLGDSKFSLSSFGFDSISGRFFSYISNSSFTTKLEDIQNLSAAEPANTVADGEFFGQFLDGIFPFSSKNIHFVESLSSIWENIPQEYISALQEVTLDAEEYDIELTAIKEYFESARSLILEKVK